jgi:hypothetical protein
MSPHCIHLHFPWYGLTVLLTDLKTVTNLFCKELTSIDLLHLEGNYYLTVVHFVLILRGSWPWPRFMRQECQWLNSDMQFMRQECQLLNSDMQFEGKESINLEPKKLT